MADVFISYKSERRNAAAHIAEILELNGYSVWYDYQLVKGKNFAAQIDKEIRAAKAVLVLWCARSVNSDWVHEEADLASELGTLIPAAMETCSLRVGQRQKDYVDLKLWCGGPLDAQLSPLLSAIAEKVGANKRIIDVNGLRRYDELWRRFGAPDVSRFMLDDPLEQSQPRSKVQKPPAASIPVRIGREDEPSEAIVAYRACAAVLRNTEINHTPGDAFTRTIIRDPQVRKMADNISKLDSNLAALLQGKFSNGLRRAMWTTKAVPAVEHARKVIQKELSWLSEHSKSDEVVNNALSDIRHAIDQVDEALSRCG